MEFDPIEISPFAAKDMLVEHARAVLGPEAALLDASRGGPNWQQRTVLNAWTVLQLYADYCYGSPVEEPYIRILAGASTLNHATHFARFADALADTRDSLTTGVVFLQRVWEYLSKEVFPERWIGDTIESFTAAVSGGYYPSPATLDFMEPILNRYLSQMLGNGLNGHNYRVHLDNGATGAFGHVVATMARNRLLEPGDKVAIAWPWYEPMMNLFSKQYGCEIVPIRRRRESDWHVAQDELAELDDPAVKLVVVVAPGNPVDITVDRNLLDYLEALVARRPDLTILCDYVYANFVPNGFDNELARMPKNVIPFYAPSKDYGLVGARIGAAWLHPECALERRLREMPEEIAREVDAKYNSRRPNGRPSFYDRVIMDSCSVSFSHMAGLATPSQVLYALCALYPLVMEDEAKEYFGWVRTQLADRMHSLYDGLGLEKRECPGVCSSNYCALVQLDEIARKHGPACEEAFSKVSLWDFLKHLAHSRGTIIMPGPIFGGEPKSARLCLTALDKPTYNEIGRNISEAVSDYGFPCDCPHCEQKW